MYRKNTAGQNLGFALVSASTGAALTGATVTVYRVVDGLTQASATGTVSEKGNGQYNLALSQADTNGNQVSFLFVAPGAVPVEKTIVTTAVNPTESNFGMTNVSANTVQLAGQTVNASSSVTFSSTVGTSTLTAGQVRTELSVELGRIDVAVSSRLSAASYVAAPSAAAVASQVRSELATELGRIDVAVSTRLAASAAPANFASLAITGGGAVTVGTNSDKTGYSLAAAGLDVVSVEAGLNARQALAIGASALAGVLSGAGTTTITIKGAGVATTRITATVDTDGNRSAVVLNPPA